MLATRTMSLKPSGTAAARATAKSATESGAEIIDLSAGEIWSDLSPTIRTGAIAAIDGNANRYTDTVGISELRSAIARKVAAETGLPWSGAEVAVTTGAKQALFNTAMALLDPGDEVIIPSPYWTTFPTQVTMAGGVPVFVDTRRDGYVPRVERIEDALTDRTRMIIVNTPGNPTGAVYDQDTLKAIARCAMASELWLVFDECYGTFVRDPHAHRSILALVPEARARTVLINGFSKSLALTGWRIGYAAGPGLVIDAIKAFQSHTTSNPNVIAQHAVLHHLESGDTRYETALAARIERSRQVGLNILSELSCIPLPPAQGGFYFYLDLTHWLERRGVSRQCRSADDVVSLLLSRAGVAGVSGSAFGDPAGLRLSYGVPPDILRNGLQRLTDTLNSPC